MVQSAVTVTHTTTGENSSLSNQPAPIICTSAPFHIPSDIPLPPPVGGKSHARKTGSNTPPKSRNAYILFRSHFNRHNPLPQTIAWCTDQTNVSRVSSHLWRLISEDERAIIYNLIDEEKKRHATKYPSVKYTPSIKKAPHAPSGALTDEKSLNADKRLAFHVAQYISNGLHGDALANRILETMAELSIENKTADVSRSFSPQSSRTKSSSSSPYPSRPKPQSQPIRRRTHRRDVISTQEMADINAAIAASNEMEEQVSPPPSSPSSYEPTSVAGSSAASHFSFSRATSPACSTFIRESTPFTSLDEMTMTFEEPDHFDFNFDQDPMDSEIGEYDALYWEEQAVQFLEQQNEYLFHRGRTPFDPDFLSKYETVGNNLEDFQF